MKELYTVVEERYHECSNPRLHPPSQQQTHLVNWVTTSVNYAQLQPTKCSISSRVGGGLHDAGEELPCNYLQVEKVMPYVCFRVNTRACCRRSYEKKRTHAQHLNPCWWTSKQCRTFSTYLRARGTAFTRKSESAAWTLLWVCPQAQTPALGVFASLRYLAFSYWV